jgi:hypothetical protein
MREEELTEQFLKLMDKIDLNETAVQMKFHEELKRYNKFNKGVLGINNPTKKHKEVELKTYAKYILTDGSNEEKRELMGCFKSKIVVVKGVVKIEEQ